MTLPLWAIALWGVWTALSTAVSAWFIYKGLRGHIIINQDKWWWA